MASSINDDQGWGGMGGEEESPPDQNSAKGKAKGKAKSKAAARKAIAGLNRRRSSKKDAESDDEPTEVEADEPESDLETDSAEDDDAGATETKKCKGHCGNNRPSTSSKASAPNAVRVTM